MAKTISVPIWHPAEPRMSEDGKRPYCASEDCSQYDGKRCMLLGFRPGNMCEPAVSVIVDDWIRLGGKP